MLAILSFQTGCYNIRNRIIVEMSSTNSKNKRTQANILFSSVISSSLSTTLTNPIEVAKLKLQYAPTNCPRYPHSGFRDLYNCGCASFKIADTFKGLSVMMPQVVINNLLFMQLYEFQRKYYLNYMSSPKATVLSSLVARVIVTTVLIPVEALRVRISNSTETHQIKTHQKGLGITLARDLIYSALFWMTAQEIRNYYVGKQYRHAQQKKKSLAANILAGGIGGGLIASITTPLDTIKTRIQSGMHLEGSIWKQILGIYHKQGLTGLFSGVHYRTMKSSTHSALYLVLYQNILHHFEQHPIF